MHRDAYQLEEAVGHLLCPLERGRPEGRPRRARGQPLRSAAAPFRGDPDRRGRLATAGRRLSDRRDYEGPAAAGPSQRETLTPTPIGDTSVMASGLAVGGDVEQALENVGVPSYVLDETGVVRWMNAAAEQLVGNVRGRHFTSVVAPEDRPGARERFAQKMLGTSVSTEVTGDLVSTAGTRVPVEVNTVPLTNGERVVGVFGLIEERQDDRRTAPPPNLTPRQAEVLRLLERGYSTKQIAAELHLSTETVRNHIRRLFRALGVNSRLEAVAAARTESP